MILIKSIEIVEVEEDRINICITPALKERLGTPLEKSVNVTREMVQGRRYATADGREIVIGMMGQVQDAIGLPYKAFENLTHDYEHALTTYRAYKNRIENMSFWKRLKGLFMGFK